jgi:hypothetical protein
MSGQEVPAFVYGFCLSLLCRRNRILAAVVIHELSRQIHDFCSDTRSGLSTQESPSSHLCFPENLAREADGWRKVGVSLNLQDNIVDDCVDGVEVWDQGGKDGGK